MAMAAAPTRKEVVFVCEHGTVKSVIAAELFNRLAAERKVPLHAVSRGVSPDEAIPGGVAGNLAKDGFDVSAFRPQALAAKDVENAARVIAIGVESPLLAKAHAIRWDDIPPASTDYAASRDAMRERMGALIDSLSKKQK
jgi:protein-tyrosine-phosphatase